jgi:uncharacterized protein (TIGR02231 family)
MQWDIIHFQYVAINAPYIKTQLYPASIEMETLGGNYEVATGETFKNIDGVFALTPGVSNNLGRFSSNRKSRSKNKADSLEFDKEDLIIATQGAYNTSIANQVEKDLRMEFQIETPFSIPSDDADHRVAIATYQMKANYEYHAVPKLDESVYLVAQISGWEKLNLLNGESNLYFDGTYIGKSFIDVNSSKDTLSFSLGKDKKIIVDRKRSEEMSKTRLMGNRYKYEVTWDFTIRNNGGAAIPIIVKDHFPISINDDIKVKQGSYVGGALDEKTGILTWKFTTNKGETKQFKFDYQVDYGKNQPVYLE